MVGSPTSPWPVCPQEGHHFSPFFMDFNQAIPVISRSTFFFVFSHANCSHTEVDPVYVDDIPLGCLSYCWGSLGIRKTAAGRQAHEPCGPVLQRHGAQTCLNSLLENGF